MSKKKDRQIDPILEGLTERRTVFLTGKIDDGTINAVGEQMITLQMRSPDKVNLIIDSGGGSIYPALRLCDLISTILTTPVRGIALGACGSAATFIMLHCNERLSTPHSQFLIHSGTQSKISVKINQTTSESLERLLKDVKATEEMVLRLYMDRLTPRAWANKRPPPAKRREYVEQLIRRGDQDFHDWLSAEEAVEAGLVTKVVRNKLDIFSD